jgi:hypothetical protein
MNLLYTRKHIVIRLILRVTGPVLTVVGLLFFVIGLVGVLSALESEHAPVAAIVSLLAGGALLVVGMVSCMLGYLAIFVRYIIADSIPVLTDATNDLVEGARGSIEAAALAAIEAREKVRIDKK